MAKTDYSPRENLLATTCIAMFFVALFTFVGGAFVLREYALHSWVCVAGKVTPR